MGLLRTRCTAQGQLHAAAAVESSAPAEVCGLSVLGLSPKRRSACLLPPERKTKAFSLGGLFAVEPGPKRGWGLADPSRRDLCSGLPGVCGSGARPNWLILRRSCSDGHGSASAAKGELRFQEDWISFFRCAGRQEVEHNFAIKLLV